MTKGKLAWLSAIVGLLLYECYALTSGEETLSAAMATIFDAWPFFGVLVGAVVGGLLVHFFWRWDPPDKKLLVLFLFFPLLGCSPMFSSDIKDALVALSRDRASACLRAGGGGGAMTIAPGAGVPLVPGGGGYGSITICRSNEPGSKIEVSELGAVKIEHGATSEMSKRLDDLEAALKYLLQKIAESAPDKKGIF
jgi:MFS family permease